MTVYEINNKITQRRYVGATLYYEGRVKHHLCDLRNQRHHSFLMQQDFNLYGAEPFVFSVIKEFSFSYFATNRAKNFEHREIIKSTLSYNYVGRARGQRDI